LPYPNYKNTNIQWGSNRLHLVQTLFGDEIALVSNWLHSFLLFLAKNTTISF
jgi:hypothetical protein